MEKAVEQETSIKRNLSIRTFRTDETLVEDLGFTPIEKLEICPWELYDLKVDESFIEIPKKRSYSSLKEERHLGRLASFMTRIRW
jgi:hypothetical protein